MITCDIKFLKIRCAERGYTLDEVKECIVSQKDNIITIDEKHPSYPSTKKPGFIAPQTKSHGPGTELKKLLSKIGITATPTCACNARAREMDAIGPDECEKRIDEIVGWLKEEATKRNLPFIDYAGKMLIKRAIKNARKNMNKRS